MTTDAIDTTRHPIGEADYVRRCRTALDADGALVLEGFFAEAAIEQVVEEFTGREGEAFYAGSTHNVYLTPPDPDLAPDHAFNRQVASSKGLLADDQIARTSPLREVYDDRSFRSFLATVLGIDQVFPYADDLSSINVHFASAGRELGWHFDNSSFAVTMLLQAPEGGGVFEFVAAVRDAENGEQAFDQVDAVLDEQVPVQTMHFDPGSLVLFPGPRCPPSGHAGCRRPDQDARRLRLQRPAGGAPLPLGQGDVLRPLIEPYAIGGDSASVERD